MFGLKRIPRRFILSMLALLGVCGCGDKSNSPAEKQRQAIAALKVRGAKVSVDRNAQATRLIFLSPNLTDADMKHLKWLTSLTELNLEKMQITDAGLKYLPGLTKIFALKLNDTRITNAGLEHLKGLTKLEVLGLTGTKIAGAGLVHLKGLTSLRMLQPGIGDQGLGEVQPFEFV